MLPVTFLEGIMQLLILNKIIDLTKVTKLQWWFKDSYK